jgi:cobalt/nickel transport system permease protein
MSLLSDLYSDLFARQDNRLTRMDARTKLCISVLALLMITIATKPHLSWAVLAACTITCARVGVPFRFIALRLTAPMGIAIVLLILQSLMTGSTPILEIPVMGTHLTVTREGWQTGVLMSSRVLGGVSVMLLLSSITPAHRIFLAMRTMGVPGGWVEIAMLMYRYIFVLLDMTSDVLSAQRLRLGYSSVGRGISSAGVVAGVVVLNAVDQATRTHAAMISRGYQGEIPMGTMPPLAKMDIFIIAAVTLAAAAALTLTNLLMT